MRYPAVVFDLLNTLVPYQSLPWDEALAEIAALLDASPDAFAEAWRSDRGRRDSGDLEDSLRRVCAALGLSPDDKHVQEVVRKRREISAATFVPRDEAVETLAALRGLGVRTGLITNCSSEIPGLWEDSPLAELVDATVFSCAEGVRKPKRRLYELAAARLGVSPRACLYVGDGADDELRGAAETGMQPVLLRTDTSRARWDGLSVGRLGDVPALVLEEPR